ncbi:SPOR domain-containing protein [Herminiimonas sp. CN]|uniref:SPOR domain-containing protein n=1 Tax=Herminiimonas sp. CN TaxID=1349818 RepID=UPI0004742FCB|nr:SPOR domain-containing protein [Herminiimonas sp. CN]
MLKFIFWLLLLTNGALLALNLGALDAVVPNGREPQRLKGQIHPEQLILLSAGEKAVAPVAAAPVPAPPALIACTEIGNFPLAEAGRFETQLAALALGERQSRRNVDAIASYIVYIPSQGDQAGAQKKVAELRGRGISNFFIMQDNANPDLRWGISLGVFRTEAAARRQLAALKQQGVQSARIGSRSAATSNVAFQVRDLDPAGLAALERIAADFPQQQLRRCE